MTEKQLIKALRSANSYNKLAATFLKSGENSAALRKAYNQAYSLSQARIAQINKSDVRFTSLNGKPNFVSGKTLSDADKLIELVELNKFLKKQTVKKRRARRDLSIETTNRRIFKNNPVINTENWEDWTDFWTWYRQTKKDKVYASAASVVQEAALSAAMDSPPAYGLALELFNEFQKFRGR